MAADLSDPNSSEIAKLFFFFEVELDNLPESREKWRLQEKFETLKGIVEQHLDLPSGVSPTSGFGGRQQFQSLNEFQKQST